MSKMSKAIAVLGVVAGLGVAAMPLSSYAASNTDAKDATVQVTVGGAITLTLNELTSDELDAITTANSDVLGENNAAHNYNADKNLLDLGEVKVGGAANVGAIKATAKTNDPTGYQLTIRSQSAETALIGYDTNTDGVLVANGANIPAGTTLGNDNSAWAYKVTDGATAVQNWTEITANDVVISADNSKTAGTPPNATADTIVTFGVSAEATQLPGTYKNTVVFTATVNN